MTLDLVKRLAKINAMRDQCMDTRRKIDSAKESLHEDVQEQVEVYGRMAQRGKPGAGSAFGGLAKNRAMIAD